MTSGIKTRISAAALAGLFLVLAAAATPARAAIPELMNFQGRLTDSAGRSVTTAVPVVFKLYTAASGGSPVWTETQNVTPDAYGVYSVLLGENTPLAIDFSAAYWLGVAVGNDTEMLPRYKIVPSAYSFYSLNSATAAWAGGADWPTITNKSAVTVQGNVFNGVSQLVQVDTDGFLPALNGSKLTGLPTAFLADGSVTTVKLAANAVTDAKVSLSTAAITSGKFGDDRVAISTQAVSGGVYNAPGRLVQLGADGFLPALNGSFLTSITKSQVGLSNVTNTSDAAKPVSTAQQTALDLKADLDGAAFTGAITASNLSGSNTGDENASSLKTKLGAATSAADGYLTSIDWTAFNAKLSPSGNGSGLTGLTKAQVGLGNVTNTSDAAKPVSTAQQTALDLKADLAGATFTGGISAANLSGSNTGDESAGSIKTKLGAASSLADGYLTSIDWTAFNAKLAPSGNGSGLTGLTKAQVGLGNVTNTSDAAKPVSTAQQTALDLKADLTGAAFTGAISATNLSGDNTGDETAASVKSKLGAATSLADGYLTAVDWAVFNGKLAVDGNGSNLTNLTKAQVGLGNVNNTSDAAKPVSTAQQTALDLKADLTGAAFTGAITASNLSGGNTGDETAATIKTKLGAATSSADGYLTSVDWAVFNGKLAVNGNGSALTNMTAGQVGLGNVTNTSDAAKPVSTAQQTALDLKADLTGAAFTGAVSATNLSGTNTGDNAANSLYSALITNAAHTGDATGATALTVVKINGTSLAGLGTGILKNTTGTGVPSIAVAGDFPILNQDTSGNAATVTTNADLTGVVTSVGNATSIGAGAITNAMLFNGAVANLSGTNTGDNAANSLYSGLVTNAAHTGDATGATALTVVKINGTLLAGLGTGILKNTTGTGVPSIAVAGDFPILNQNTTGNAATATSLTDLTATIGNLNTVTGALGTAAFTASGDYATAAQGVLAANALPAASFTDAAVTGKLLTGYVSGAGTVTAADSILTAIQKLNGNDAGNGDVFKAATQTFTGFNTFTATVAAKGFVNASQAVLLTGDIGTFAVDGSGIVMLNQSAGVNQIASISGCNSGAVGQGQMVTFVMAEHGTGTLTFHDATIGVAAADTLVLKGDSVTWAPSADSASRGSTITLLCTTLTPTTTPVKLWVEIGRSISNVGTSGL